MYYTFICYVYVCFVPALLIIITIIYYYRMYDMLITVLRYIDIVHSPTIQFFLLLLNRRFQKCKIFVPNTVKHVRVGIFVPNNSRL